MNCITNTNNKKIHVNQHNIKHNNKLIKQAHDNSHSITINDLKPVFTVKEYNRNTYGYQVMVNDSLRLTYSPFKPLSCGAHVWLETNDTVQIIQPVS
jgi:hypothetical protein